MTYTLPIPGYSLDTTGILPIYIPTGRVSMDTWDSLPIPVGYYTYSVAYTILVELHWQRLVELLSLMSSSQLHHLQYRHMEDYDGKLGHEWDRATI